jgi:hypothetical protein
MKSFQKTLDAIITLTCIFVIGITPSLLISTAVSCLTDATMLECTTSSPFWMGFVVGVFISSIYLNTEN